MPSDYSPVTILTLIIIVIQKSFRQHRLKVHLDRLVRILRKNWTMKWIKCPTENDCKLWHDRRTISRWYPASCMEQHIPALKIRKTPSVNYAKETYLNKRQSTQAKQHQTRATEDKRTQSNEPASKDWDIFNKNKTHTNFWKTLADNNDT